MVIFDGEYLCVQVVRGRHKAILRILKKSQYGFYIRRERICFLPATKKNVRILSNAGYPIDNSAKMFLTERSLSMKMPNGLFQFQKEGVEKIMEMQNVLLADEMGLGKTVQAAVYLSLAKNTFPALIICPASLKENWVKEIKKWTGKDSRIINGKKTENLDSEKCPVIVINYDILGIEDKEAKTTELKRRAEARALGAAVHKKTIKVNGWCDILSQINFQTIIADEVQYIAEPETIRTRAVNQICATNKAAKKIFISGTPYETKTSQFFTTLHIIAPSLFPNRFKYLMRYCDPVKNFFGWKFNGLSNGEELHNLVSTVMIRRRKKDVLFQLPPKIRSVISLTVSEKDRKIYDNFDEQFADDIKNKRIDKSKQVGHIASLKKQAYLAKEKSIINWVKEYLQFAEVKKLVIFVYHHVAYDSLMNEFDGVTVGINGKTPPSERQGIVDKFQTDEKIQLFVGQIKAAGVGLTLTAANATAFAEFGTTCAQHEQAEDRVHRIGQKSDSVLAYYLILPGSVDEDVMTTLEERNKDISKVMDNEDGAVMFEAQEKEMKEKILEEYKKRKKL